MGSWVRVASKAMYIVQTDGEKHSAWDSKQEAAHQKSVLIDHGYKNVTIDSEEGDYENGHYFV